MNERRAGSTDAAVPSWTFLTNHARVLVCIAEHPEALLRDLAERLGVTERTAWSVVSDLIEAGYLVKERDGRRNRYTIQKNLPLHDSPSRERTVGEVLDLLAATGQPTSERRRAGRDRRRTAYVDQFQ